MQPKIRLDLCTGRTGSGEKIGGVEGSRTPEPVVGFGCSSDLHDPGPIEHGWGSRVTIGDHSEDDLRVPQEHRGGERDVE